MAPKKYTEIFVVTLSSGKRVGSFRRIEEAEFCASKGLKRKIYQWIDGKYVLKSKNGCFENV